MYFPISINLVKLAVNSNNLSVFWGLLLHYHCLWTMVLFLFTSSIYFFFPAEQKWWEWVVFVSLLFPDTKKESFQYFNINYDVFFGGFWHMPLPVFSGIKQPFIMIIYSVEFRWCTPWKAYLCSTLPEEFATRCKGRGRNHLKAHICLVVYAGSLQEDSFPLHLSPSMWSHHGLVWAYSMVAGFS